MAQSYAWKPWEPPTTLVESISSFSNFISLVSSVALPPAGVLVIDRVNSNGHLTPDAQEYVSYQEAHKGMLVGVKRGINGSTAQAHPTGAIVELVPTEEVNFKFEKKETTLKDFIQAKLRKPKK